MYTHLRSHSTYSFLRGVVSPLELVKAASEQGMRALALTDFHSLTGAIEFYDACLEEGVHPIIGMEVNLAPPSHITGNPGVISLLAMDIQGWTSICRLSSMTTGEHALPYEIFSQLTAGLICLTGGRRGLLTQMIQSRQTESARALLSNLKSLFITRLYVEIQIHSSEDVEICRNSASLAARYGLPTVATHDIHYLTAEQSQIQKVLTAIRLNQSIDKLSQKSVAPPDAIFLQQQQMEQSFADYPSSIGRSDEIVGRCQLKLPLGKVRFPEIECPSGLTVTDVLRQKAEIGAKRLYGRDNHVLPDEVRSRLDKELAIIDECGYAPLFLIVEEILTFARVQGIPYSSRGSAASSLVAHCLGVTTPDPIRLNLYFERFLNPARATPPDIDTDLCSRGRERVIKHVYEQFGEDRVATVCTINRFRSRSALREVAKAYGLSSSEINRLTEMLPNRWYRSSTHNDTNENPYAELSQHYTASQYQTIFSDAKSLIGIPHHLSVHPGGIVISPGPMTDWVPTQMTNKGIAVTQLDLDSIERIGLVKIDLLGIRGLTVLGDVTEQIIVSEQQPTNKNPALISYTSPTDKHLLHITEAIESIPDQDPLVSDMIGSGKTIGCFQIESPGMRSTLREIHAQTIDDIMVALALYRPGPLTGGLKTAFVQRHLHREVADYLHPSLAPLLHDTYGVILYQEQVLRIAHELGGLSMADADLLRRAMSHFDPGKQMQTLKEKFVAGAYQNKKVPEEASLRIWNLMAAFAGYGFPKAHAASYALISWRSAWCKSHYPALFMAAVLANWGGFYSQRVYITEARRLGLSVRPPHINFALREFSVSYLEGQPVLFMGLDQVRDLSKFTQEAIVHNRPFNSFIDFLVRVDPRPAEARILVEVGALDGFGAIPDLLNQIDSGIWAKRQFSLFGLESNDEADWSLLQKSAAQSRILGASVTSHPLEIVADQIEAAGVMATVEATSHLGEKVRIAGLRQTWRSSQTTTGNNIYIMALEDLDGYLDVVIYPDIYRQSKTALSNPGPYIIEGYIELDEEKGEPFIRANKIWRL